MPHVRVGHEPTQTMDRDREAVIAAYESGEKMRSIAFRYRVSVTTVSNRLAAWGARARSRGSGRDKEYPSIETLIREYEEGDSTHVIGRRHGVSWLYVRERLAENGTMIRARSAPRSTKPYRPTCRRCGLLLELMAWEEKGVCCACIAILRGDEMPLGGWIWAETAGLGTITHH